MPNLFINNRFLIITMLKLLINARRVTSNFFCWFFLLRHDGIRSFRFFGFTRTNIILGLTIQLLQVLINCGYCFFLRLIRILIRILGHKLMYCTNTFNSDLFIVCIFILLAAINISFILWNQTSLSFLISFNYWILIFSIWETKSFDFDQLLIVLIRWLHFHIWVL